MRWLINQAKKRAKSFVFPTNWYSCNNTNEKIIANSHSHLRAYGHIKIAVRKGFVKFYPDKIPRSRNHIMKIAVDLPLRMKRTLVKMLNKLRACIE